MELNYFQEVYDLQLVVMSTSLSDQLSRGDRVATDSQIMEMLLIHQLSTTVNGVPSTFDIRCSEH